MVGVGVCVSKSERERKRGERERKMGRFGERKACRPNRREGYTVGDTSCDKEKMK